MATAGTAEALQSRDIDTDVVYKVGENRPHIVDRIINGEVDWIVNTPLGMASKFDEQAIRRTALERGLPIMTTLAAAKAAVLGIRALREEPMSVVSLQEHHRRGLAQPTSERRPAGPL
jgi:carbamoyl-phosphate synthase large subunit